MWNFAIIAVVAIYKIARLVSYAYSKRTAVLAAAEDAPAEDMPAEDVPAEDAPAATVLAATVLAAVEDVPAATVLAAAEDVPAATVLAAAEDVPAAKTEQINYLDTVGSGPIIEKERSSIELAATPTEFIQIVQQETLNTYNMLRQLSKIYILQLNNNKYYIGRSFNPEQRIAQHQSGTWKAARWVNLWGVKNVIDIIPESDVLAEDILTKGYMMQHGIQHVRGGTYFSPKLLEWQLKALQMEFDSAMGKCFKCGYYLNRYHKCPSHNDYMQRNKNGVVMCYYCREEGHRMMNCPHMAS